MRSDEEHRRRVLVIGAGGSLGRALTAELQSSDRWVAVSADRTIDVSVASQVDELVDFATPDAIVNLAGMTGARCSAEPERAWAVNVGGARNVARAAERRGVTRIVFPSTSGVYGDRYSSPVDESAATEPGSVYAETKLLAESEYSAAESPVILRIFNVFGPGLGNSLVQQLLSSTPENPVGIVGLDGFVRDYSAVEDIARVLIGSLDLDAEQPTTLNVGTGVPTSTAQLIRLLERNREVHYTVRGTARSYSCASVDALAAALGGVPRPIAAVLGT